MSGDSRFGRVAGIVGPVANGGTPTWPKAFLSAAEGRGNTIRFALISRRRL